jgi:hypothetical protein
LTQLHRNQQGLMASSGALSLTTFTTSGESSPVTTDLRWLPFDPSRNWPDLGTRFSAGENKIREAARLAAATDIPGDASEEPVTTRDDLMDEADLSWSTVLKRTFEAYLRAERPNMYGEWLEW